MGSYRVLEYLFNGERRLSYLIGGLATDVVKIGVASTAGYIAGAFVVSQGLVAGPLLVSVIVGGAVALVSSISTVGRAGQRRLSHK